MSNPWIEHVKDFAKRNNVSYGCAISMSECKSSYAKTDKTDKTNKTDKTDKTTSDVKYFILIWGYWSKK